MVVFENMKMQMQMFLAIFNSASKNYVDESSGGSTEIYITTDISEPYIDKNRCEISIGGRNSLESITHRNYIEIGLPSLTQSTPQANTIVSEEVKEWKVVDILRKRARKRKGDVNKNTGNTK